MFENLCDEMSKLWSWRWPTAEGEVILVEIERVSASSNKEILRLSIVYSFSIGEDGPYGGEGFWQPAFSCNAAKKFREARRKLRAGHRVLIRYRPDDPSINKLDRSVWNEL
jgi:hypothetical protein